MAREVKQVTFTKAAIPMLTRVAAYARVSSAKNAMHHSLSAQVSYYSGLIQNHPGWQYIGVYADEAKTGTKDTREGFVKLVSDCKAGEVDMVITKSISRFARNTVMLAAEAAYCAMEDELREYLNSYESTHDYDEYHFDLDEIEHDPYVLISMITALKGGEWTIDEIGGILETLFEKQYILTETVATETRYRTETHIGYYTDENGNLQSYEYEAEVPYTYYICHVELENFNLSHVPVHIMSHDQLSMYAVYMSVLGNRPDLFPGSPYVNRYYHTQYEKYEIPPEALADEQFAAVIKEAEKYLGYPYIWGGSTPDTSFDCSGFVSYVYNNCGLHWNFGRLGAEGLRGMCAYVSPESARPGDLIFFEKTYDTAGASHVGIYVGNNRMLHCGDPIHYASIDTSYWRSHFLQFGRLP